MGSLMAGWSTAESPKKGLGRSKSFTKDEIEHFWKTRQLAQEEHLRYIEQERRSSIDEGVEATAAAAVAVAGSHPFPKDFPDDLTDAEKKAIVRDWWTKSNYACLNTPPEEEWKQVKKGTFTPEQFVLSPRGNQQQQHHHHQIHA
eukprot:jgi/Mesen1/5557/ME000280S04667